MAPALQPDRFVPFKLVNIREINHNTKSFRFEIPSDATELGLHITSCLLTKWNRKLEDGKDDVVIRPYTPVTIETDSKHFDLVVKRYENGNMSKYIHSLKVGDILEMKGPMPKFKYTPNQFEHIGMVAGGSGITPMLQLLDHIKKNKEDKTKISFIFANTEERDILLREYLDKVKKEGVEVHYILSRPSNDWKEGKGHVGEADLEKYMPKPGKGKVFVCGPPGMMQTVSGDKVSPMDQGPLQGLVKKMGYSEQDVFKF